MKNAIETKNLTKIYKNFTAVNSLNLEIPEKKVFLDCLVQMEQEKPQQLKCLPV